MENVVGGGTLTIKTETLKSLGIKLTRGEIFPGPGWKRHQHIAKFNCTFRGISSKILNDSFNDKLDPKIKWKN